MKVIGQLINKLETHQYIKLIAGASFTDTTSFRKLVATYINTGICCIDVACDLEIIEAASEIIKINQLEDSVGLMVSFPLDEDPHFRKIKVNQNCIDCGLCVPTCPTEVFSISQNKLQMIEDKCYGCSRCLSSCPTDALSLEPFSVMKNLKEALSHPMVSAVEIHSAFVDEVMIEPLFEELGTLLESKLLSICLQPQKHPPQNVEGFLMVFKDKTSYPLIVQVDGKPMSATLDPKASIPAIEAATDFYHLMGKDHPDWHITLSGGINQETASLIKTKPFIKGVGIGSAAKLTIWEDIENPKVSSKKADNLIKPFLEPLHQKVETNSQVAGKESEKHAII